jgi:hypothetical protein
VTIFNSNPLERIRQRKSFVISLCPHPRLRLVLRWLLTFCRPARWSYPQTSPFPRMQLEDLTSGSFMVLFTNMRNRSISGDTNAIVDLHVGDGIAERNDEPTFAMRRQKIVGCSVVVKSGKASARSMRQPSRLRRDTPTQLSNELD